MTQFYARPKGIARASVLATVKEAWQMRRVWWFTATARTRARFVRTYFGSFWLGLSNLFRLGCCLPCTAPFLKCKIFILMWCI